ncbi:RimK-like ATP-grasp domain-containing protein [Sphingomonas guangdongensis]|uniref:RimK-like ATP-grasp domain-containing protein n=1 Tax=Sphingomonas guangdongensis TaxID=1141890 RepID=A0A285QXW2_9SPHN|nr:alpha-L-glutamate ligase [Sphingomonas guangdongensis]SOB86394.1 RimK-like ATP-grasp domain-containing protein [Sphingomonas guangdongensis]
MTADLAILYEHPQWFRPLFAALDRRGIPYGALEPGTAFDPADAAPPAPLVLSRLAMSAFLREREHPIFWAGALLARWELSGARVLNGTAALAVDTSKARQLALIASLGLAMPATRAVHRAADVPAAAEAIGFPLVVKANIGGAGAGIARYDSLDEVRAAVADGTLPTSIDGVLLVQDYVPARGGTITRIETLDRSFLYALEVAGAGAFDLCPADACQVPGSAIAMTAVEPAPELRAAAEAIARAASLDLGGVEVMIDDRDGVARFYDINALSNFVAKPLDVLGWDPHERLVDRIEGWLEEAR